MNEPRRREVWMVDLGMTAKVRPAQSLVTIPHAKLIRKMGTLSMTQLAEVERAVAKWLGLESQDAEQTG